MLCYIYTVLPEKKLNLNCHQVIFELSFYIYLKTKTQLVLKLIKWFFYTYNCVVSFFLLRLANKKLCRKARKMWYFLWKVWCAICNFLSRCKGLHQVFCLCREWIWSELHVPSLTSDLSKPQQLSTYALTLFQYKTLVDGIDVRVGEYHSLMIIINNNSLNARNLLTSKYSVLLFCVIKFFTNSAKLLNLGLIMKTNRIFGAGGCKPDHCWKPSNTDHC